MLKARISENKTQSLKDHINGVKDRIISYGCNELLSTGTIIGLLHDMGKASLEWQQYLESNNTMTVVPHSVHGACFVRELETELGGTFENDDTESTFFNKLTSEIIQFVILAHHGLFDITTIQGVNNLSNKIQNFDEKYGELFRTIKPGFISMFSEVNFSELYCKSVKEIATILGSNYGTPEQIKDSDRAIFEIGMLVRFLLSQTIDADWSDAAAFSDEEFRLFESDDSRKCVQWDKFIYNLENKLSNFSIVNPIDHIREQISGECLESSIMKSGIYKMDVPTGGGKTLASMRYALNHSKIYDKSRIIYTAPYTSILEQNADQYKNSIANSTEEKNCILSHYSDVVRGSNNNNENEIGDESFIKFSTQRWNNQIILTTMVQMLNTLFSANKQSVRRMHNLYNSTIIFDEVQVMPVKCTNLFNLAVNTLAKYFRANIILCTATQPPFENKISSEDYNYIIEKIDYSAPKDLVNNYSKEEVFDRVKIIDHIRRGDSYEVEDMAELIRCILKDKDSLLVILNTRSAVNKLYNYVYSDSDIEVHALSNDMCPAHRFEILNNIKSKLKKNRDKKTIYKNRLGNKKILLISTSLIEAGVDISFESVIRSLTGLDIIIQAAGRCNRSGELEKRGELFIVNPSPDFENIEKLIQLKAMQASTIEQLDKFRVKPSKFDYDIADNKMLTQYFKNIINVL